MRKIMIMLAAVATTLVASAATTNWKLVAGNIYASDATTKYTGNAIIYCVGAGDGGADLVVATEAAISSGVAAYSFSSTALTAGTTYDFYFTFEDNGMQFTSSNKTGVMAVATGTANIQFGNMQSATQDSSNWQAVPEPTSGLLMLLGVAGLALRRRRA